MMGGASEQMGQEQMKCKKNANALISELNFLQCFCIKFGIFCIHLSLRGNEVIWIIHVQKMKNK